MQKLKVAPEVGVFVVAVIVAFSGGGVSGFSFFVWLVFDWFA